MRHFEHWRNKTQGLIDIPGLITTWAKSKANQIYGGLKNNKARVFVIALFVLLATWAVTLNHYNLVIGYSALGLWATTFLVSVGPELAGIVIGVVTIDYLNERRQEKERKTILIAQLGSSRRDITEQAIIELRNRGWLYDGSLSRINLKDANLGGADLRGAVICGADLRGANLREAWLPNADLSNSLLGGISGFSSLASIFPRAFAPVSFTAIGRALSSVAKKADLSGAMLWNTSIREADLDGVEFSEAELRYADLSGVRNWTVEQLEKAKSLKGAIMPDGVQLAQSHRGIVGPTFEVWKEQYLAKHGGSITDTRNR